MPTAFGGPYLDGEVIYAAHVNQFRAPVNNLEVDLPAWGGNAGGVDGNSPTVTLAPVPTAYTAGMRINFVPTATNTGAVNINVNSLGAKSIKKYGVNLLGGELRANQLVTIVYDGTNFQMVDPRPLMRTDSGGYEVKTVDGSLGTIRTMWIDDNNAFNDGRTSGFALPADGMVTIGTYGTGGVGTPGVGIICGGDTWNRPAGGGTTWAGRIVYLCGENKSHQWKARAGGAGITAANIAELSAAALQLGSGVSLDLPSDDTVTAGNRQIVGTSTGIILNVPTGTNFQIRINNIDHHYFYPGSWQMGETAAAAPPVGGTTIQRQQDGTLGTTLALNAPGGVRIFKNGSEVIRLASGGGGNAILFTDSVLGSIDTTFPAIQRTTSTKLVLSVPTAGTIETAVNGSAQLSFGTAHVQFVTTGAGSGNSTYWIGRLGTEISFGVPAAGAFKFYWQGGLGVQLDSGKLILGSNSTLATANYEIGRISGAIYRNIPTGGYITDCINGTSLLSLGNSNSVVGATRWGIGKYGVSLGNDSAGIYSDGSVIHLGAVSGSAIEMKWGNVTQWQFYESRMVAAGTASTIAGNTEITRNGGLNFNSATGDSHFFKINAATLLTIGASAVVITPALQVGSTVRVANSSGYTSRNSANSADIQVSELTSRDVPTLGPASSQFSVVDAANQVLATGSFKGYMVLINDTDNTMAYFRCINNTVTRMDTTDASMVAGPGAGEDGIEWDGATSRYRILNNKGATKSYTVVAYGLSGSA